MLNLKLFLKERQGLVYKKIKNIKSRDAKKTTPVSHQPLFKFNKASKRNGYVEPLSDIEMMEVDSTYIGKYTGEWHECTESKIVEHSNQDHAWYSEFYIDESADDE